MTLSRTRAPPIRLIKATYLYTTFMIGAWNNNSLKNTCYKNGNTVPLLWKKHIIPKWKCSLVLVQKNEHLSWSRSLKQAWNEARMLASSETYMFIPSKTLESIAKTLISHSHIYIVFCFAHFSSIFSRMRLQWHYTPFFCTLSTATHPNAGQVCLEYQFCPLTEHRNRINYFI